MAQSLSASESDRFFALSLTIADLVDNNDHSEAMAVAAEAVKDKELAAAFRAIDAIAEVYGHLPHDLSNVRYDLYSKRLKPQLQSKAPEILEAL